MATTTGLSPAQVQALIIQALVNHRNALNQLQNLYKWSSGLQVSDMETAAGVSQADATTYLSALADGNAEAVTHFTGLPPGSYPQPASTYVYGATQAQVIGPQ
jgi:hypothetical protein